MHPARVKLTLFYLTGGRSSLFLVYLTRWFKSHNYIKFLSASLEWGGGIIGVVGVCWIFHCIVWHSSISTANRYKWALSVDSFVQLHNARIIPWMTIYCVPLQIKLDEIIKKKTNAVFFFNLHHKVFECFLASLHYDWNAH